MWCQLVNIPVESLNVIGQSSISLDLNDCGTVSLEL